MQFNNKVGNVIHPPSQAILAHRPETPRVKHASVRKTAALLQRKLDTLQAAFTGLDTNEHGKINVPEVQAALQAAGVKHMNGEECAKLIAKVSTRT